MRKVVSRRALSVLVAAAVLTALSTGAAWSDRGGHRHGSDTGRDDKLLFFASDGLRQDAVEKYARQGVVPGFRDLLRKGARASGNGLLTQAPPNTGAGWFTLNTGAWPGVHGSTNNTFHVNGQPFGNRTAAFDAGVLQAETLAQSAERGGKKVAQIEWAGGRGGAIDGPTLDFRRLPLGPRGGHELHSPYRLRGFHPVLRAAVRPPGRLRRQRSLPAGCAFPRI